MAASAIFAVAVMVEDAMPGTRFVLRLRTTA